MQHDHEQDFHLFLNKTNKTFGEMSNVLKNLFGNLHILLKKLSLIKMPEESKNQSGLNIQMIVKLYTAIDSAGKNHQVQLLLGKSLSDLKSEQNFTSFFKSTDQLKIFLVLLLWSKIFTEQKYKITLNLYLELFNRANQDYRNALVQIFKDIPHDYFRFLIQSLLKYQNELLQKYTTLKNQENQAFQLSKIGEHLKNTCSFMGILYLVNKNKRIMTPSELYNKTLMNTFPPHNQFQKYIKKTKEFCFLNYTFLFDSNYKYKLIQIQSIYEQKKNIKKNMNEGFANMIGQIDYNNNFNMEALIYLQFEVNRNYVLEDSMEKLNKIKESLKNPLKIKFIGEEGADLGGVKNEYFALITKAIFNPYLDMFIPKNNNKFYWFNGYSSEMPLRFQFLGMILALSIYNGVHLDIHFPQIIYKKLISKDYEQNLDLQILQDIKEIQPQLYSSFKNILSLNEPIQYLQIYFNIQFTFYDEKRVEQLVQDGHNTQVNNDNKEYYVMLYVDYLLNKHIAKQFNAFKRGFNKVVSGGVIKMFTPEELRILTAGVQEINLAQLQLFTQYEGYTLQSPIIKSFWEYLHTLTEEEKKKFMMFCTGTDRVPIGGLKSLKFTIQRHLNTNHLPTAHTCFNVLLLPDYSNKQLMIKHLKIILENNQGFGLI